MTFDEIYEISVREIEKRLCGGKKLSVAIDGCAASGKTTLASRLSERFSAPVLHMDDFFLRPFQRTPERYAEAGGNIDRERFCEEVLPHVSAHDAFSYRRFDCSSMSLENAVLLPANDIFIVEGTYSCHEAFAAAYNLKIFLALDPEEQRRRVVLRGGKGGADAFFEKWIPLENAYFNGQNVEKRCDLVFYQ